MNKARPSQMNLAFDASKWGEESCAASGSHETPAGKSGASIVSLSSVRAVASVASNSAKAEKERSLLNRALQSVRFF